MAYTVLALNALLLVFGQTVWKMGLERAGGLQLHNWLSVLFSPLILLGLAAYGVATILWLYVLSKLPLSVAYPLQSVAYVLGIVVAMWVFKEYIPPNRWVGAGVLLAGIAILSWK